MIDTGICYLTLCKKTYPKQLAFSYLDEVKDGFVKELQNDHGAE